MLITIIITIIINPILRKQTYKKTNSNFDDGQEP